MNAHPVTVHLAQGHYDEAAALCEQAITANPEEPSHYWYLGLVRLLQGDDAEAHAVWFSATTMIDPATIATSMADLLDILLSEADRQIQTHNPHVAEVLCWQALELDAERPDLYLRLGEAIALQGKLDEAIEQWQTATALQPNLVTAYQQQGEVFQKLEQWEEAIAAYTQALTHSSPDSINHFAIWETHYNLGLCLGQQERWQEALEQFDYALQQQPNLTMLWGDRAWALLQQGYCQDAIIAFRQAVCISGLADAYRNWVETLKPTVRSALILENAEFFQSCQTENSTTLYQTLGNLLARNGNWQLAIEAYRLAWQDHSTPQSLPLLDGHNLAAYIQYAESVVETMPQLAVRAYQVALQQSPHSAESYLKLGQFLVMVDRDRAIVAFQQALQLQPDLAEAHSLLARYSNGDWHEKITHYRKALALQPDRPDTLTNIGYALAEAGHPEEAITYFQKALALFPAMSHAIESALNGLIQRNKLNTNQMHTTLNSLVNPPSQVYETTEDWIATQATPDSYNAIDPPSEIHLTPPKSSDRQPHFSFRFGQAVQLPGSFVVTIPNGRFWLSRDELSSAVLTADNQLLGDVSPEFPLLSPGHPDSQPSQHSILSLVKLPPTQMIDGSIAVLAGLTNDMYFHWMFDVLPRFHLLDRSGIPLDGIDGFVVSHHLSFQQETLNHLGISSTKILETKHHSHIQANSLIVPSYPGTPAWMPKWACDWLRQIFLPKNSGTRTRGQGGDRLYISRQQTGNRRIINEAELVALLNHFGFESITLEQRSVVEQAALLSEASVVISPHGGGLTNTVFCQPGTKIVEIFSPHYVYPCYWLISNLLGLDYYYLTGKTPEGFYLHQQLYPDARTEDIFVDLTEFKQLLKLAEIN